MSTINHEHRHVFIHVPKTGGTAMEREPWVGGNGHATAAQLVPQAPDYFAWGFVRHPCDRLLSAYSAACQHGGPYLDVARAGSFESFVSRLEELSPGFPHSWPQTHFLCDLSGRILVDFVGAFENLQNDWRILCARVGVPCAPLPRLCTTEHPPWEQVITRPLRKMIQRHYAADFEVFCYG